MINVFQLKALAEQTILSGLIDLNTSQSFHCNKFCCTIMMPLQAAISTYHHIFNIFNLVYIEAITFKFR